MQAMIPRYDMYAFIHKALRAFMTDTLLSMGRMDCEDDADTAVTLGQVRGLLEMCRAHLDHENRFVHTAMDARAPGSADRAEKEHREHLRVIDLLETDVFAVEHSHGEKREHAAGQLYRQLAVFVAENLEHMQMEETDNNRVLWALYTDEELRAIEGAIVASQPPEKMIATLRWMLPALNPSERGLLIGGMRQGMPAEAFHGMLEVLRPLLGSGDWCKLERVLA
ncbi:hemerythrin domain-containing protein [Mangrovitalea sediminis]|uniref:hemerythrin domain-containing protein n=1 Tax=Mangrovitalea sediminis TaxID=1982043 RepID=UPI000BE4C9C9|nr:hypothetical protein [Mangrovitalea sediminis]